MTELERLQAILSKVDATQLANATERAYPTDELTRAKRIASFLLDAEFQKAQLLAFPPAPQKTGGESSGKEKIGPSVL